MSKIADKLIQLINENEDESWENLFIKFSLAYEIKYHLEELEKEIEKLQVQLAGCSCAALGDLNTVAKDAYGWSPAYQDVVDLRLKYEKLQKRLNEADTDIPMLDGATGYTDEWGIPHKDEWTGDK